MKIKYLSLRYPYLYLVQVIQKIILRKSNIHLKKALKNENTWELSYHPKVQLKTRFKTGLFKKNGNPEIELICMVLKNEHKYESPTISYFRRAYNNIWGRLLATNVKNVEYLG